MRDIKSIFGNKTIAYLCGQIEQNTFSAFSDAFGRPSVNEICRFSKLSINIWSAKPLDKCSLDMKVGWRGPLSTLFKWLIEAGIYAWLWSATHFIVCYISDLYFVVCLLLQSLRVLAKRCWHRIFDGIALPNTQISESKFLSIQSSFEMQSIAQQMIGNKGASVINFLFKLYVIWQITSLHSILLNLIKHLDSFVLKFPFQKFKTTIKMNQTRAQVADLFFFITIRLKAKCIHVFQKFEFIGLFESAHFATASTCTWSAFSDEIFMWKNGKNHAFSASTHRK